MEENTRKSSSLSQSNKRRKSIERATKQVSDFITRYSNAYEAMLHAPYSADRWNAFVSEYYSEDYMFIRPSGKHLTANGLIGFYKDRSVENFKQTPAEIQDIKIIGTGASATVVYMTVQECIYKGEWVKDKATWMGVLLINGSSIKFTTLHRSHLAIDKPSEATTS